MNAELKLTAELFEPLIGSTVTIVSDSYEELWRVTKVERRASHSLREVPFNLYLDAPATPQNRAQGMRRARLPSGEAFDFFVVPVAASAGVISLEAIFN